VGSVTRPIRNGPIAVIPRLIEFAASLFGFVKPEFRDTSRYKSTPFLASIGRRFTVPTAFRMPSMPAIRMPPVFRDDLLIQRLFFAVLFVAGTPIAQ